MSHSKLLPITRADKKLSKKHLKATIKLEKKKVKDHLKAAKKAPNSSSKAYNLGHARDHQKDLKDRYKHLKKVNKVRVR